MLLAAADALRDACDPAETRDPRPDSLIHAPEMMLRGFAVECLLKGLWVKRGNRIVDGGEYVGIPGTNQHDLIGLAQAVGQPLTTEQAHVLKMLTVYLTRVGRYPIPRRASQLNAMRWRAPDDTTTLERLVADLSAQLRAPARSRRRRRRRRREPERSGQSVKRKPNDGVRKMCGCARKRWSECEHSWYFNFQWKGRHYRFSLDRELNKRIGSKADAETKRNGSESLIQDGKFRVAGPMAESLTLTKLFANTTGSYLQIHRKATAVGTKSQTNVITKQTLPHPTRGESLRPMARRTSRLTRSRCTAKCAAPSPVAANRDLALLRAMFRWGASKKRRLVADNPFRDGDQARDPRHLEAHGTIAPA